MGQWTRAELEETFEHFSGEVAKAVSSGDWESFVQCFTPDATYVEHAYGNFAGHDEIRAWITRTMGTFPGNEMIAFPAKWVVFDEEQGLVVCDIRNLMRDPGDGSVHEASNLTVLRYAGDGRWREEEDVYNPADFLTMVTGYLKRCAELGTVSDEGRAWAAQFGIDLGGTGSATG